MKKNNFILAFLAFSTYFVTGVVCMLLGSLLSVLATEYGLPIEKVVLIGSSFALGRVLTVYLTGKMVEKFGPLKILFAGVSFIGLYLVGMVIVPSYYMGFVFAFLGGIGMGVEDAVCPLLLSHVFTKGYSSSLSAGQAMYGLGGFAISLLVGLMFTLNVSPYYANYILVIIVILILLLIPLAHFDNNKQLPETEHIKPLYCKNNRICYLVLGIICFIYCVIVNSICTYTSIYGEAMGISNAVSTYMLTIYNVGCVIGSIIFIFALKRISENTVLFINSLIGAIVIFLILKINNISSYFICFMIAGIFLGVLFSVILAIVTRIGYQHIALASSIVAITGGIGDIIGPIITSNLVAIYQVAMVFKFIFGLLVVIMLLSIVIGMITKEENLYVNSK